jgi:hypothetical protein
VLVSVRDNVTAYQSVLSVVICFAGSLTAASASKFWELGIINIDDLILHSYFSSILAFDFVFLAYLSFDLSSR